MDWERRVAHLKATMDEREPDAFLAEMRGLCATRPPEDALAAYELGSAHDSIGRTAEAVPLYRAALAAGLDASRRRQAVIQLASSLRNLGRAHESVTLLRAERDEPPDDFDDAVVAFLALALVDVGSAREAVSLAVTALARRRERYRRSLTNYAADLLAPDEPAI